MGFEVPNEKHNKTFLEVIQEKYPDKGSIHSIMENVANEEEMNEFFELYVDYAKNDGAEKPKDIVLNNLKYIIGQFSDQGVINKWVEFLSRK